MQAAWREFREMREATEAAVGAALERGGSVRATGSTKMNEISSRSPAVFIIIAEQSETVYVDENGREMAPDEFAKAMHQRGVPRHAALARLGGPPIVVLRHPHAAKFTAVGGGEVAVVARLHQRGVAVLGRARHARAALEQKANCADWNST